MSALHQEIRTRQNDPERQIGAGLDNHVLLFGKQPEEVAASQGLHSVINQVTAGPSLHHINFDLRVAMGIGQPLVARFCHPIQPADA